MVSVRSIICNHVLLCLYSYCNELCSVGEYLAIGGQEKAESNSMIHRDRIRCVNYNYILSVIEN